MSELVRVVDARAKDLGDGVRVARVLPQIGQRNVGPFVFLDHFGPAAFAPGHGLDVRPHPHIGLATVTCLFDGEITQRDSLGFSQVISPGEVNWRTAGRGIVHSERSGDAVRASGGTSHGLQFWVALPLGAEECEPAFVHHGAGDIPARTIADATIHLIAGTAFGHTSPVATHSRLFYAIVALPAGARITVAADHPERAVYVVDGGVTVAGVSYAPHQLLVLGDQDVAITATAASRVAIFGGDPLDAPRHLLWNFASSSPERLLQARDAWKAGAFPIIPGDSDERIPFPD